MESIQKALLRVRPPRVKITYDVEIGNAIEKKELPFLMGVLADLAGENSESLKPLKERSFVEIDRDNFDKVLSSINPKITVSMKDVLSSAAEDAEGEEGAEPKEAEVKRVSLAFNTIADFEPGKIVEQIPELKALLDKRIALSDLTAKLDGNDLLGAKLNEIIEKKELKDQISAEAEVEDSQFFKDLLSEVGILKDEAKIPFLKSLFVAFVSALEGVEEKAVSDVYSFIVELISKTDSNISKQLDEVMHTPEFQKLEASWRGLNYLVFNSETGTSLKIRLLCITKKELIDDLDKAVEFDQSQLFKKVYEEEYGTLGGTPYSCLVTDFAFGRHPQDIQLLRNLSTVAAAAHAPLLGGVDPHMFDMDSFANMMSPRDIAKIFESSEMIPWQSFRNTEDSRYVNLFLPRTLMRLPYGSETKPCDEFDYEECVDGASNAKFCWGNPAFAMAQKITHAFSLYGWTAAIRGVEGGGKVDQLPTYTFKSSDGDIILKCPTEVAITDRREKELSDLGFISLCHAKGTDYAAFFSGQSTQKAKKYNLDEANANAMTSARLPYLLNASRFAHYIKMMMRDKIGSFMSALDVEFYLQNWIADYVLLSDIGSHDLKAKYPLREASIQVVEVPGSPGAYKAVIFLRPHFQLEELNVSLRLVAKIPGAGA